MKIDPQRLRALREQRAWSQEHLAAIAGLSARTVQRVEHDGSASKDTRMALATAFGVTPDVLCGGGGERIAGAGERGAGSPRPGEHRVEAQPVPWPALVAIGLAIVLLLAFLGAYQVGKDRAQRDNRVDCEASGRRDCR